MRDTKDKATAELDGLPEYQRKIMDRDNMAKRAAALGYQGPKERPRCETCANCTVIVLNPDALNERERHKCQLGAFDVQRGGICPKHRDR
jgi:hypothetical protein